MSILSPLVKAYNDFLTIIYPNICIACKDDYAISENCLCIECSAKLGYTDHFTNSTNALMDRLAVRTNILHGAALLNFVKNGVAQQLIHQIKYGARKDLAHTFGKQFGERFNCSSLFSPIDCIIPIPLHKHRRRERGYNQSEEFALGMAQVLSVPVITNCLVKKASHHSQTDKSRVDRFENVLNSYKIINPHKIKGASILLVDDVVTTGATIEAALELLKSVKGASIQIGTLALAHV